MKLISSIIISIFILSLFACNQSNWEIPKENYTVEREWIRFDLSLIEKAENTLSAESYSQWEKEYPRFLPLYVQGVMRFGPPNQGGIQTFSQFLNDEDINELFQKVKSTYGNSTFEQEQAQLNKAFSRFQYHFPEAQIPEVYTFLSAFTYTTVADDSLLGIGLDMYLGKDYKKYAQAGIPKYKFKYFEREYMVADAMRAWLVSEFNRAGGSNLLSQMIYQGKIAFLMHAFLYELPDHLLINYTQEELTWCEENEAEIWFHFVEMELLHTMENHLIRKYMGEAPFIAGFPEGSPGRVGQWMGYKIVEAFMKSNPNTTLKQLIEMDNADLLLQQSNYKPKR